MAAAVLGPRVAGPLRLVDVLLALAMPILFVAWRRNRGLSALSPRVHAHRDPGNHPSRDRSERLYLCFLGWAAVSAVVGLATGTAGRAGWTALTLLRLAELVAAYALARYLPREDRILHPTLVVSLALCAMAGMWELASGLVLHGEPYLRAFNEGWFEGEATHVGGGLAVLGAAAVYHPARAGILALIGILCSGSRTALAAILVVAVRAFLLAGRSVALLVFLAIAAGAFAVLPSTFRERALAVIDAPSPYRGPHVERFTAWRIAAREAPPWGVGVGARPSAVYESHYAWLYAETGLPGLVLGVLVLVSLIVPGPRDPATDRGDPTWRARTGIAFVLLTLSFGVNVLLVSRIALPAALLLGAFAPALRPDGIDEVSRDEREER